MKLPEKFYPFWFFVYLFIVLVLFAILILIALPDKEEPIIQQVSVVSNRPDYLKLQEYDIADDCGELGKLYVVTGEWVFFNLEDAEMKMEEME